MIPTKKKLNTKDELDPVATSDIPFEVMKEAFELCKQQSGNECLCDSGKDFDLPRGSDFTVKQRTVNEKNHIELKYGIENAIIDDVVLCDMWSIASDRPLKDRAEPIKEIILTHSNNFNDVISYDFRGNPTHFKVKPLKLFKYQLDGKDHLCFTRERLNIEACQ